MQVESKLEAFREKFKIPELSLLDDGAWILSVRPGQLTLGSMVLSSASGRADFSALEPESGPGFLNMLMKAEAVAKALYGAVRINAVCLMMQDPVVHFHILPRYDKPVERYGLIWRDEDWPGPPVFRPLASPGDQLENIRNEISAWLGRF